MQAKLPPNLSLILLVSIGIALIASMSIGLWGRLLPGDGTPYAAAQGALSRDYRERTECLPLPQAGITLEIAVPQGFDSNSLYRVEKDAAGNTLRYRTGMSIERVHPAPRDNNTFSVNIGTSEGAPAESASTTKREGMLLGRKIEWSIERRGKHMLMVNGSAPYGSQGRHVTVQCLCPEADLPTFLSLAENIRPYPEEQIHLYTWLPESDGVLLDVEPLKQYIAECDIVAEVDQVDVSCNRIAHIETEMTREFHVKDVKKGDIPAGSTLYEELYLEEEHAAPGKSTASYKGAYWLLLKKDCVSRREGGRFYIDHSATYFYHYFLYGGEMQGLLDAQAREYLVLHNGDTVSPESLRERLENAGYSVRESDRSEMGSIVSIIGDKIHAWKVEKGGWAYEIYFANTPGETDFRIVALWKDEQAFQSPGEKWADRLDLALKGGKQAVEAVFQATEAAEVEGTPDDGSYRLIIKGELAIDGVTRNVTLILFDRGCSGKIGAGKTYGLRLRRSPRLLENDTLFAEDIVRITPPSQD